MGVHRYIFLFWIAPFIEHPLQDPPTYRKDLSAPLQLWLKCGSSGTDGTRDTPNSRGTPSIASYKAQLDPLRPSSELPAARCTALLSPKCQLVPGQLRSGVSQLDLPDPQHHYLRHHLELHLVTYLVGRPVAAEIGAIFLATVVAAVTATTTEVEAIAQSVELALHPMMNEVAVPWPKSRVS